MSKLKYATSNRSTSLYEPVKILASEESFKEFKPKTVPEYFHECCEKYTELTALAFKTSPDKKDSNWTTVTYSEYERQVEQAALAFLYLGVPARSTVAILAANCPEWFYAELGAMRINAVAAGIYSTSSSEAVYYILDASDASVVVVDDSCQMAKIREIRSKLPKLKAVIQLNRPYDFSENDRTKGYYRWSELMEMEFEIELLKELGQRGNEMAPNDCALLIFTVSSDTAKSNLHIPFI